MALRPSRSRFRSTKGLVRPAELRALAPVELGAVGSIAFVLTSQRLHLFHFQDVPGMVDLAWSPHNPRGKRRELSA